MTGGVRPAQRLRPPSARGRASPPVDVERRVSDSGGHSRAPRAGRLPVLLETAPATAQHVGSFGRSPDPDRRTKKLSRP